MRSTCNVSIDALGFWLLAVCVPFTHCVAVDRGERGSSPCRRKVMAE